MSLRPSAIVAAVVAAVGPVVAPAAAEAAAVAVALAAAAPVATEAVAEAAAVAGNNPTTHKYTKIYLIVWFAHTKLSPQARDLIPSLSLLNKYKNVII